MMGRVKNIVGNIQGKYIFSQLLAFVDKDECKKVHPRNA